MHPPWYTDFLLNVRQGWSRSISCVWEGQFVGFMSEAKRESFLCFNFVLKASLWGVLILRLWHKLQKNKYAMCGWIKNENYESIKTTFKWSCVSIRGILYMGIRYTLRGKLSEDVSWHLMCTRVGSIVQTRKFVLIPKRYLSFSWWARSVCMLQSELMDLWSVRVIRSVCTFTRDSLIASLAPFSDCIC